MKFQGIILAGGRSSRFGEDKALAKWEGLTLLESAVFILRQSGMEPCVIANALRDYSFLDCRVEKDLIQEKGPLGGLFTAMRIYEDAALLILTCDMPFLKGDDLKFLMNSHEKRNEATLFHNPDKAIQPFPGIYESSLFDAVRESIEKNQLSMEGFIKTIPDRHVIQRVNDSVLFTNINEKRDLEQLTKKKKVN